MFKPSNEFEIEVHSFDELSFTCCRMIRLFYLNCFSVVVVKSLLPSMPYEVAEESYGKEKIYP